MRKMARDGGGDRGGRRTRNSCCKVHLQPLKEGTTQKQRKEQKMKPSEHLREVMTFPLSAPLAVGVKNTKAGRTGVQGGGRPTRSPSPHPHLAGRHLILQKRL